MTTDLTLPEQRTHRDQLADRTEVLDRVGALMLLPGDAVASTELVAGFYGVDVEAIKKVSQRNRDELDADGFRVVSRSEFERDIMSPANLDPRARSIALFPRRAILRVGMLLRDSHVARAVRDALLDAERQPRPPVDLNGIDRSMLARWVIEAEDRAKVAEVKLLEAAPAVEYHDRFVSVDDVTTVQDWAAQFGMTEPAAFDLLREQKLIRRILIEERWSKSKQKLVREYEHRAYAGPTFAWFDVRPQHNVPRHHNGQVRRTLYIRQAFSLDLGHHLGLHQVGKQGELLGGEVA